MAFPLSWLNCFLPTMLRTTTTAGAKRPFPSLTFFIIGCDRTGLPTRTRVGHLASMAQSSLAMDVAHVPVKEEQMGTEVAI